MRRRTRHGYPPFAVLAVRARSLRPGLATSGIGQDWELGRNFGGKITDPLQPVFAQDLSGAVDGRAAPGWPARTRDVVEANTAPAVAGMSSGNSQQGIGAIAFSGKWLSGRYEFKGEHGVSLVPLRPQRRGLSP